MGGWGRQNPWPFQWGGGKSAYERLWDASRAMLGERGPGPVGGLEDAYREAEVCGLLLGGTAFERAVMQALPQWATDHLPVYEEQLGIQAVGEDATRREAVTAAWVSVRSSINPELVQRLHDIDPNIDVIALDPDATSDWQHGRAYADPGVPITGMGVGGTGETYPNYSQHHVMHILWSGCPAGIPPADKRAELELTLNRDLPSWVDYAIITSVGFYLDGFLDSRLDLTAFGT